MAHAFLRHIQETSQIDPRSLPQLQKHEYYTTAEAQELVNNLFNVLQKLHQHQSMDVENNGVA
jgi:hypothetical protein